MKVPDVAGMKYTTAVNTLVEKGFEVTEPNIVYTDDVEVGDVIKTEPVAGRVVKENAKITILSSCWNKKSKMAEFPRGKTLRVLKA
ncbi:Serine/threonine protein kinase [Bacillus thuringiensis serovar israelensis ATCC 35646]|nr:Serine/threonine protein kinase [Bacillus thuringiensis serovar israelensis ATCC 35646]